MFLQKNDLVLRPAKPEDADLLSSWWSDGRIMGHAGFPDGLDINPQALAKDLEKDSDADGRRIIIEIKNVAIGEMSYRRIEGTTAEIGIKICNFDQRGKGFGTTCLEMLRDYLLYESDFEKIILDTNLNNKRAQHVYEKLGFKKEKESSWKDQRGIDQRSVHYYYVKGEKDEGKN